MGDDTSGYSAAISRYEEILAKDPESFCFAPLSDAYRRAGRLDDALEVALRGCELHPKYIAGYMALGRACYEKGLYAEGRQALEKVVQTMPDNLLAHTLLSRIYETLGDTAAAGRSEEVLRSVTDEDEPEISVAPPVESIETLYEAIKEEKVEVEWGSGLVEEPLAVAESAQEDRLEDDDEILDLTDEVLDEDETPADEVFGEDRESGREFFFSGQDDATAAAPGVTPVNPLSTVTIAELYVSQGGIGQALDIYRELFAADPGNMELQQRIDVLTRKLEEKELEEEIAPVVVAPVMAASPAEERNHGEAGSAPDQSTVLETLEAWLANIRRMR